MKSGVKPTHFTNVTKCLDKRWAEPTLPLSPGRWAPCRSDQGARSESAGWRREVVGEALGGAFGVDLHILIPLVRCWFF